MTKPVFSGERFIPGQSDPVLSLEHYHRYLFAAHFVKGKRVLDVACGEGYGAEYLSLHAQNVIGIDNDPEIVAHARKQYAQRRNLEFRVGQCEELSLPENSVDVVVSFETLEHLDAEGQDRFLVGVKRSLAKGGLLILSSPEREVYAESRSGPNEFHRHELEKEELSDFLRKFFAHVHFLGQDPVVVSLIRNLSDPGKHLPALEHAEQHVTGLNQEAGPRKPLYLVALCSDERLEGHSLTGISSLYFDARAPERTLDLLKWGRGLEHDLGVARDLFASLQKEFEERSAWAVKLDAELHDAQKRHESLQREFDERTAWALSLDQERVKLELRIQELDALRGMLEQQLQAIKRSYGYRFLSFLGLVPK